MSLRMDRRPDLDSPDDELVARFHDGDSCALDVLLQRYRRFARAKARTYFLVGADADDIEQEGLIGLYKAARDFRPDRQSSFRAFAELCITRQVITAIKTATRHKHQPLNQYVSISATRPDDEPNDRLVEKLLGSDRGTDPAEQAISRERMEDMRRSMAEMLSVLEVDVLRLYVEGKSYQEISERLGRAERSVRRLRERVRKRLERMQTAG